MSIQMIPPENARSRLWLYNTDEPEMTALYLERDLDHGLIREELQSRKRPASIIDENCIETQSQKFGLLLEDLILQGGVDTSFIKWIDDDGIGRIARNGINFTERGFGIRGALGCSDRGNTAVSQLDSDDVDWDYIFGDLGVRWLHTGGIFAGLSDNATQVIVDAAKAAQKYGTIVSYDLNYRPSLWKQNGGLQKCRTVNRRIANHVDVLIGNEGHYSACLGIDVEGGYEENAGLDFSSFRKMSEQTIKEFPNVKVISATIRKVKTTTINDWASMCYANQEIYTSSNLKNLEILDRVGGGDSFASGFIYGLMYLNNIQKALEYGTAHGALAMTTPGDTTMVNLSEVEKIVYGGGAIADR